MSQISRIQIRRGNQADWEAENTLLADGEIGLELDNARFKVGNGTDVWDDLDYWEGDGPQGPMGPQGAAGAQGAQGGVAGGGFDGGGP
jgi:hypothetical protein